MLQQHVWIFVSMSSMDSQCKEHATYYVGTLRIMSLARV